MLRRDDADDDRHAVPKKDADDDDADGVDGAAATAAAAERGDMIKLNGNGHNGIDKRNSILHPSPPNLTSLLPPGLPPKKTRLPVTNPRMSLDLINVQGNIRSFCCQQHMSRVVIRMSS